MIFSKKNYYTLAASVLVLILGYYLMYGATDIMSPIKISVAPVLIIVGYVLCGCSIFVKK